MVAGLRPAGPPWFTDIAGSPIDIAVQGAAATCMLRGWHEALSRYAAVEARGNSARTASKLIGAGIGEVILTLETLASERA